MANLSNRAMAATSSSLVAAIFLLCCLHLIDAQVGVAYGNSGDNLPPPSEVVSLYKSNGIREMRIYYPDPGMLQPLQGSGIELALGVGQNEIQSLASNPSAADQWVQSNVKKFATSVEFKYIVVGNEIKSSDSLASSILPAMTNVLNALNNNDLGYKNIKVTTSIGTEEVINAYPPSSGQFRDPGYMTPIINFLKENGSPLMANIYPYFAHKFSLQDISLEYALFTMPPEKAVNDTVNGLPYQNAFDALADATYAAIQRTGVAAHVADVGAKEVGNPSSDVSLLASESGWPSSHGFHHATRLDAELLDGGDAATLENARTYYTNL